MGQDGEVSNNGGSEGNNNTGTGGGVTFVSVEFEVYGHVQGSHSFLRLPRYI